MYICSYNIVAELLYNTVNSPIFFEITKQIWTTIINIIYIFHMGPQTTECVFKKCLTSSLIIYNIFLISSCIPNISLFKKNQGK